MDAVLPLRGSFTLKNLPGAILHCCFFAFICISTTLWPDGGTHFKLDEKQITLCLRLGLCAIWSPPRELFINHQTTFLNKIKKSFKVITLETSWFFLYNMKSGSFFFPHQNLSLTTWCRKDYIVSVNHICCLCVPVELGSLNFNKVFCNARKFRPLLWETQGC